MENRILNVFYDNAVGGLKRLRNEIGLTDKYHQLRFDKQRDIMKLREQASLNPDVGD